MKKQRERTQTWNCDPLPARFLIFAGARSGLLLVLVSLAGLWGCSGSSSTPDQSSGAVSGNWQFSLTAPADSSFTGGLQGGFLLQQKSSLTGQVTYAISVSGSSSIVCGGSAPITGTVTGQNVSITAVAGSQTFTLTGTLSADGSTLAGTYSTVTSKNCGTAQSGLQWSARSVPPLTGSVQGYFHSTSSSPPSDPVTNQDFQVTGSLSQGPNTGANSATVSGKLNFQSYPCIDTVSVTGQISGSSLILKLIGANGLNVGQIGTTPATSSLPAAVTLESSAGGGYFLQGTDGYGVSTKMCQGNAASPGDVGNVCLALGNGSACKQALSLSPASLIFPAQPVGSVATSQTIKIMNTGIASLDGLQLFPTGNSFPLGDFNGIPNFTEQDNCSTPEGSTFSLGSQQSCTVTVLFSPEESCPWEPTSTGAGVFAAPSQCPPFEPVKALQVTTPPALSAAITVTCPSCTNAAGDMNSIFAVPISGLGLSAIQPSIPELDFGAEDATLNEVSMAQSVQFTNQGNSVVQILSALSSPPCGVPGQVVTLPRPATAGAVSGLQVVSNLPSPPTVITSSHTIQYTCDIDTQSQRPNFQIVQDGCSGTSLNPQESCSVSIVYAPQPKEAAGGLDYFLQLNTLQCTSTITAGCEIDSGRFPVELKSALASSLRVSPGAGLDFGTWPTGQTSFPPLTVTLSNDGNVANPQPINFTAIVSKGDYTEVNDCGISLAPGSSCTMTITFTPKITGFDQGSVTVTYSNGQTNGLEQVISLRGFGQ